MKTKALLLTLMVLAAFSCSNDDNGHVEEQEEQVETHILKSVTKRFFHNGNPSSILSTYFFNEEGVMIRSTAISESVNSDINFYYNSNNLLSEKIRYEQDTINLENVTYEYDSSNRLIEAFVELPQEHTNPERIYQFEYEDNFITMTESNNIRKYSFDNTNKLIMVRHENAYHYYQLSLGYSNQNVILLEGSSDIDPPYSVSIEYDDKINPLYEDFDNFFDYHSYWSDVYFSHNYLSFSPNNFISLEYSSEGAIVFTLENEIEYNESGYPVFIKQIKNGDIYFEITFEYYE